MLVSEFGFLHGVSYDPELLLNKGKIDAQTASKHLQAVSEILGGVADEDFTALRAKEVVMPYADQEGRGAVLWPLRVALSGMEKSPDPFTIAGLVGKAEALARIAQALKTL